MSHVIQPLSLDSGSKTGYSNGSNAAAMGNTATSDAVVHIQQVLAKSKSKENREGGTRAFMATGMEESRKTVRRGRPPSTAPKPINQAIPVTDIGTRRNLISAIHSH